MSFSQDAPGNGSDPQLFIICPMDGTSPCFPCHCVHSLQAEAICCRPLRLALTPPPPAPHQYVHLDPSVSQLLAPPPPPLCTSTLPSASWVVMISGLVVAAREASNRLRHATGEPCLAAPLYRGAEGQYGQRGNVVAPPRLKERQSR